MAQIDGTPGDDTLRGGPAADLIRGGAGRDSLDGAGGDDTLQGGAGADSLDAGPGDDRLEGGPEGDVLFPGPGRDTVEGGAGDDVAVVSRANTAAGPQSLDGGPGTDVLSAETDRPDISDDLVTGFERLFVQRDGGGPPGRLILTSDQALRVDTIEGEGFLEVGATGRLDLSGAAVDVEAVLGNTTTLSRADLIIGSEGDDSVEGGAGDDTIRGLGGDDNLDGTARTGGASGDDRIEGGAGDDRLFGGDGDDTLEGGPGADELIPGSGRDRLDGGDGDDTLWSPGPGERIAGGRGEDLLLFRGGGTIHGARLSGIERAELSGTLGLGSAQAREIPRIVATGAFDELRPGRDGALDLSLTAIEGAVLIRGSRDAPAGADSIAGTAGDDTIRAGGGADTVTGGAGADTLIGDTPPGPDWFGSDDDRTPPGDDSLSGGAGADSLSGDRGDDTLAGGPGADTLTGGRGDDRLIGGAGVDRASYPGDRADYTVTGNLSAGEVDGPEGRDSLSGVEEIAFGDGTVLVLSGEAPGNTDPEAVTDIAATEPGVAVLIPVLANDTDADGDTLTLSGTTAPESGTVEPLGGRALRYTPDTGFTGTDSFTYTVADGAGGTAIGTVLVDVLAKNRPPSAGTDLAATDPGSPVTIPVLATDTDPDGDPLRIDFATPPAFGTVEIAPDRTELTYTPVAGFADALDVFTYDVTDGRGGRDTATVAVSVGTATPRPDLAFTGLRLDDVRFERGDEIALTARIANDGAADAFALTGLTGRVLLSADAVPDAGDEPLGSFILPEALAAGREREVSVAIAWTEDRADRIAPGSYTLIAELDPDDAIDEGPGEADNIATLPVEVTNEAPPDLSVAGFDTDTALAVGRMVRAGVTVAAPDTSAVSAPFDVDLVASDDPTITPFDEILASTTLTQGPAPGGTVSVDLAAPWTQALSDRLARDGTVHLGAIIDPDEAIEEESEANNTAAVELPVLDRPDLEFQTDLLVPALMSTVADSLDWVRGETVVLAAALRNAGTPLAPGTQVDLAFRLSADAVLDAGDPLLASRSVAGVDGPKGATAAVSLDVLGPGFPPVPPGPYRLFAVIDPEDRIAEADETDNIVANSLSPGTVTQVILREPDSRTGSDLGERLDGTPDGELFDAMGGDDTLAAGAGDDTLLGGPGADVNEGGPGTDRMDYGASPAPVAVDLAKAVQSGGHGAGDRLSGIERLRGSAFDDTLSGDAGATIFRGGPGADLIEGRAGRDLVDHAASPGAVSVDLAAPVQSGGTAEGDRLSGIAGVTGSLFDDSLAGGAGDNLLSGGLGADTLTGRGGRDVFPGRLADLDGDRITDLGPGEPIRVLGAALGELSLDTTPLEGATRLAISGAGGDGATLRLDGRPEDLTLYDLGGGPAVAALGPVARPEGVIRGTDRADALASGAGAIHLTGTGGDTLLLSEAAAPGETAVFEAAPGDTVQLSGGLGILASLLAPDALQLSLSTGARIQVLNADEALFEPGGNVTTGAAGPGLGYDAFAQQVLGVPVPGSGIAQGGAAAVPPATGTDPVAPVPGPPLPPDGVIRGTGREDTLLTGAGAILLPGAGADTILVSGAATPGETSVVEGGPGDLVQVAPGLGIAVAVLGPTALGLTLETGAAVQILEADRLLFEPGGNATTGAAGPVLDYGSFAQTVLGTPVPDSGVVTVGPLTIPEAEAMPAPDWGDPAEFAW